jgi:hypothetical protein
VLFTQAVLFVFAAVLAFLIASTALFNLRFSITAPAPSVALSVTAAVFSDAPRKLPEMPPFSVEDGFRSEAALAQVTQAANRI